MGLSVNIMRGGFSAGQAKALNGAVASTVSAAGTTQTGATALAADYNRVSTVAASSGVRLPSCEIGDWLVVYNAGANPLTVYPPTSGTINQVAANGGVLLGINTECLFRKWTSTIWTGNLSA